MNVIKTDTESLATTFFSLCLQLLLQDYDNVQVVVLHKEVGVGLGFSLAGGVDQNKPVTVRKYSFLLSLENVSKHCPQSLH